MDKYDKAFMTSLAFTSANEKNLSPEDFFAKVKSNEKIFLALEADNVPAKARIGNKAKLGL